MSQNRLTQLSKHLGAVRCTVLLVVDALRSAVRVRALGLLRPSAAHLVQAMTSEFRPRQVGAANTFEHRVYLENRKGQVRRSLIVPR